MKKLLFTLIVLISHVALSHAEIDLEYQSVKQQDQSRQIRYQAFKDQLGNDFITVGSDQDCDTNNIQQAINSSAEEIRIAGSSDYFENLVINNRSLILRGGFTDCTEAEANIQNMDMAVVNGGAQDSVIQIGGSTQEYTIILEQIKITNGLSNIGGGIRVSQNPQFNGDIFIERSVIENNVADISGGGIYFASLQNDISMTLIDTTVLNNIANSGRGGGIFCFGSRTSINTRGNTFITANEALEGQFFPNGRGGGVALESRCDMAIFSGTFINNNKAVNMAGGVFMNSGSQLFILGQINPLPVVILDNEAGGTSINGDGGGVFIDGTPTNTNEIASIQAFGGLVVSGNRGRLGGGIYTQNNALISITKSGRNCWNRTECNLFIDNKTSTANGTGGAIYNDDSRVFINATAFKDNRADTATAIYSRGGSGNVNISNSLFYNNGNNGSDGFNDLFVMRGFAGARINLRLSTVTDNQANGVFGIASGTEQLLLSDSIVHDPSSGNVIVTSGGNIVVDCVIAHEVTSFSGTNVLLRNPDFVDRVNHDYHLSAGSPAIDFCFDSNIQFDLDLDLRGFDDPNVLNNGVSATSDAGADERGDEIFIDGLDWNGN